MGGRGGAGDVEGPVLDDSDVVRTSKGALGFAPVGCVSTGSFGLRARGFAGDDLGVALVFFIAKTGGTETGGTEDCAIIGG